jgi:hypothetical protein
MRKTNKPITVHVTAKEKRQIARMAKDAGISLEEFIRRAATSYIPLAGVAMLEGMTDLLNKSTARADSAIDDALAYIEASNMRIGAMENLKKSEPYEHKLVLIVNVPAGMDKP